VKYFLDLLLEKGHPTMLVGSAGSGKTVLVMDKLISLPESYAVTNIPFNFYTSSGKKSFKTDCSTFQLVWFRQYPNS